MAKEVQNKLQINSELGSNQIKVTGEERGGMSLGLGLGEK
jgi:hypothetical protein